jgi:hypothetical protein
MALQQIQANREHRRVEQRCPTYGLWIEVTSRTLSFCSTGTFDARPPGSRLEHQPEPS